MKILLGHQAWSEEALVWHRALADRARALGVAVEPLCLVPEPPAPRFDFAELDRRWRRRDRGLVRVREQLVEAACDADVFWNFNGANVHPEWLGDLPTLNVYGCFDDPESTSSLSEPVARHFDAALVGNLACLPLYRSWGLQRVAWAPLAFLGDDYDDALTPETVLSEERPVDLVFFGERGMPWRRDRLDQLAKAFPDARFHGHGWATGYVSNSERRRLYRSAKIGWNVHNSVGPVNLRTFMLPAAGVLQIGDNKCRFGQVFRLGEEAVGFDSPGGSMDECIELTRYYLEHDAERRRLAANGLARYALDYAEHALWSYYTERFEEWKLELRAAGRSAPRWRSATRKSRWLRSAQRAAGRVLARAGAQSRHARPLPIAEPPDPEVLGWAATSLVGQATRIAEIGPRAGWFAREAAADPDRTIVCAGLDRGAIERARAQSARANLAYLDRALDARDGPFDLLVALELGHVEDARGFVRSCRELAPRLIAAIPPCEPAGGLYQTLRSSFAHVDLYALPDPFVPRLDPVAADAAPPLLAACADPLV